MIKIYVVVEGGNVQNVYGPEGTEVRVLDHDEKDELPADDIGRVEFQAEVDDLDAELLKHTVQPIYVG